MYIFAAQAYLYIIYIRYILQPSLKKINWKKTHNNLKSVESVVFEVLKYIFYHKNMYIYDYA